MPPSPTDQLLAVASGTGRYKALTAILEQLFTTEERADVTAAMATRYQWQPVVPVPDPVPEPGDTDDDATWSPDDSWNDPDPDPDPKDQPVQVWHVVSLPVDAGYPWGHPDAVPFAATQYPDGERVLWRWLA